VRTYTAVSSGNHGLQGIKMIKFAFANVIIIICIVVSIIITAVVLWEYHRLNTVIPSGVLSAMLGLWGGELLIIALRQIFGSDALNRSKKNSSEDESI
jgi:hypothetical protein